MLNIKFLRPLHEESNIYPRYNSDNKIVDSIAKWCNKVLLAGNYWDLNIHKSAIFQFPSTKINIHSYCISIDDPKKIQPILLKAKKIRKGLEKKIGIKISNLEIAGAVLHLNRKIYHDPEAKGRGKKRIPYDPTRFTISDYYWMDIYVKKEENVFPLLTISAHSVGPYTYREITRPEIREFNSNLIEYFPEPDEIIVTWHELAKLTGLDRTKVYLQACLHGAGIFRPVFGSVESEQLSRKCWVLPIGRRGSTGTAQTQ